MARQVDAAAERQLVVDDDDLLMMRGADGMVVVEAEADASRHAPAQAPARERIALERVERAVVPRQDVAPQVRAPLRDEGQQLVEPRRSAVVRFARKQITWAVVSQPSMNTVLRAASSA